jgi:hypothetical protein
MLGTLNCASMRPTLAQNVCSDDRYERNEQEDLKLAIDHLYEFRAKLNKLHPAVLDKVEMMLQHNRRY